MPPSSPSFLPSPMSSPDKSPKYTSIDIRNETYELNAQQPNDYDDDDLEDVFSEYDRMVNARKTKWDEASGFLRHYWKWIAIGGGCLIFVIVITSRSSASNIITEPKAPNTVNGTELPPFAFDDLFYGQFYPRTENVEWIARSSNTEGQGHKGSEGDLIYMEDNEIKIEHVETKEHTVLAVNPLKDPNGATLPLPRDFKLSADHKYLMFKTQTHKKWRHSSVSEYIIYDVEKKSTKFLTTSGSRRSTQSAQWSPTGHSVAFIRDNDLYVSLDLEKEIRITNDGSANVMNGIADWVYEEEILGESNAFYWSPDGKHIAYFKYNDTEVPVYKFPYYYNHTAFVDSPYPEEIEIKYPKPGAKNPVATLHLYSVHANAGNTTTNATTVKFPANISFSDDQRIFTDLKWIDNSSLLVKVMNRVQDNCRCIAVKVSDDEKVEPTAEMVREENVKDKNQWVRIHHQVTPLPVLPSNAQPSYIDMIPHNGYIHLAWFKSVKEKEPVFLTSGDWEVTDIKGLDTEKGLVYFLSTKNGSIHRNLYSVSISTTPVMTAVTSHLPVGYYDVKMSPGGKYYWLNHQGPEVPWQTIFKVGDKNFSFPLNDNAAVKEAMKSRAMPTKKQLTIPVDNVEMNAVMYLPPNFNESRKYPVFMKVYGGPTSQLVTSKTEIDIHTYLTSSLDIISVIVDNRGTGFKGNDFAMTTRKRLGQVEVQDQIHAAKWLGNLTYVDASRIGIWGWSYGGYLSSKIIEANNEGVFKFGVAVAPVTDWRFYDSMYTERYMLTPQENHDGYGHSAVTKMDAFKKSKFLLIHGTGDDNVHFQQTISLVRKFQLAGVHTYRLQIYPDSDHSMSFNNAYKELLTLLSNFVWDNLKPNGTDAASLSDRVPKRMFKF
ncbi:dipeptidyl peptidase IV N-terminal region-domain-containing protein [Paraphysoderma sedebokerense]|nr:dipeptidyl peptidase IV N-terminal region-domain-containing protein [Paraphysoderma sedebokerense]